MKSATCHPDRKHYGKGLCSACWQKGRYHTKPGLRDQYIKKARKHWRKYYIANREQVLAKCKAYYAAHCAQMKSKAVVRNRKWRARRRRETPPKEVVTVKEQPKGWLDKDWWKLKPGDVPRRWLMEAA